VHLRSRARAAEAQPGDEDPVSARWVAMEPLGDNATPTFAPSSRMNGSAASDARVA